MQLEFSRASEMEAAEIAALRTKTAERLTTEFGYGYWSTATTEQSVLRGLKHAYLLTARDAGTLVGTLRLITKKPWAIDASYFTPVPRPLYLVDMAVAVTRQGEGIGRALLQKAQAVARAWPAQAIWLDAWDAPAGAGGFYARSGFREVGRKAYRGVPLIYFESLVQEA